MAITPADIEHMTFSEDKKHGYNTDEVDNFLDQLSVGVDAMLKKIADLKVVLQIPSNSLLQVKHSSQALSNSNLPT